MRGVALFRRVPENYTELHADDLDVADEGAARAPGDVVMVKGSNGSKASLVAKALADLQGRDTAPATR